MLTDRVGTHGEARGERGNNGRGRDGGRRRMAEGRQGREGSGQGHARRQSTEGSERVNTFNSDFFFYLLPWNS